MTVNYRQPGVLEIDLGALSRNYRRLRSEAAPSAVGAVVKANAYGLGAVQVSRRLAEEGCRHFFVATLAEGQQLRRALPRLPIYVFDGLAGAAPAEFVASSLTPVLNSIADARQWALTGQNAIVHVDTGMSRLGMSESEIQLLSSSADLVDALQVDYLMTHLACADEAEHPLNSQQARSFEQLRRKFPSAQTSIGNSAGIFLGEAYRGDLARAGIALYGGNPFAGGRKSPVEAVASLKARILQIRVIEQAGTIGYGATCEVAIGDRIAIVGVGYADGYPRQLSNGGTASISGRRVRVVGRVSMDLLAIDVSSIPTSEVAVGQYVELFGKAIGIDEVAERCGTISYEILTGLGSRLERLYFD